MQQIYTAKSIEDIPKSKVSLFLSLDEPPEP